MRFDHSKGVVYVRQSWLNDLIICPERARFKLSKPEMSGASDATIMGTALHYGIEQVLGGANPDDMATIALEHWEELKKQPYKQTNLDPEKSVGQIEGMSQAFIEGIMPNVQFGGQVEMKFSFPLGIYVNDWAVHCEGTMDYVQPDGTIWDWKTASRPYYAKEKQSQSIQATVYSAALVQGLMTGYPVDFRYGVMIRQEKPKSQIVYMQRTAEHHRWLIHTLRPAVMTHLRLGTHESWLMNDTSALCSAKWCDYWSICKGAFISEEGLSLPFQGQPLTLSEPTPDTVSTNNNPQEGYNDSK